MDLVIKGRDSDEIKKSEVVIRNKLHDLESRAKVAESLRELKKRKKSSRDPNAITTLNAYYKRSKHHYLEKKRAEAQERRAKKVPLKCSSSTGKYSLLVIRNKRKTELKESQEILRELNLTKPNTGRLLVNSAETLTLLKRISPLVYYGFPSLDNLRTIIKKRGTLMIEGKDEPIESNLSVENLLGNIDIICIEDIVGSLWNGHERIQTILDSLGCLTFCDLAAAKGEDAPVIYSGDLGSDFNQSLAMII